jgi:hypothetical protein
MSASTSSYILRLTDICIQQTLSSIWWEAHGAALMSLESSTRTSVHKYIHKRIACNKRERRFYRYRDDVCTSCGNATESYCHIIRCKTCNKRINLRKKYLSDLSDKLKITGTHEDTTCVIITHILAWLNDTETPQLKDLVPDATKHLELAVAEQSKLGWHQWFRGRISITWGHLYKNDIKNPNPLLLYPSADRWGKDIIHLTFKFVMECWYLRNKCEHDTLGDPESQSKEKLIEKLTWELERKRNQAPENYLKVQHEALMQLPKNNLSQMVEQISNLQKID